MRNAVNPVLAGLLLGVSIAPGFGCPGPAERPSSPVQPQRRAEQIVFSSNRPGTPDATEPGPWRIWTVNPDGSGMRPLTKGGSDEHDVDPVFSPDGKRILFTSTRGGTAGIWVMPADGSKLDRICDGDQAEWSPDGRRIVLRRSERIVTRDLSGGAEKTISPGDFPHCSGPAWSPDGNAIAFACRWDAGNAVFLVGPDGGKPAKVYDQEGACEPHWSPDGRRIVYETETHICTINPDGTKNRLVTYYGGVQRYARFSPDAKSLVFCQAASPSGPWELYVVPAAGGEPRKLTEGASDMYADWK